MNDSQRTQNAPDPGLTALTLIAQFHGIPTDIEQLRHASGQRRLCEQGTVSGTDCDI
jgi:subfamily B ATP-binding cassette protein HlyB/CyaB